MWQFGIIFICLSIFSSFHGSNCSGFDFNPHEVIRKSREIPVDLDLGVRAAGDPTEITYNIPTSITGNGADGLLQNANALSAQADNLMIVLEALLVHFNDTEGPEIENVRNMTAEVKSFEAEYTEILDLIKQINQTIADNAKNITYIENQLTCMRYSGCNTGPTTPPPPVGYDCSVVTQTVSKEGDNGTWIFKYPTEFGNCSSLTIKSQKGLWLNINITMGGAGNGNVQIKGDTSGIILFDSGTNSSASLKDQADTQFSIIITGAITFSVNFNAVGVCTATNCNFGVCSVDAANQPICACKPCYSDGVGADKKCSNYTDKCVSSGIFCGDTSYCVPTVNATTCGYYCNCPDWPTDCPYKPLDCESTTCEDDGGFDTKAFWKRDESFEDFDPYEFVQQAQEAETTLNLTMPESIIERDPYVLLADASNLTTLANALMTQLQTYLDLFNNTQSAPEWNKILPFENRLNNANATFGPLLDRFNDLNMKQSILKDALDEVSSTLKCYQESNCHITPSTTTAPPPPNYNCANAKVGKVSAAGDSGSFPFTYINQFQNCSFKIHSNLQYGLWINLQINNLILKDPTSTILIGTSRDGNFVVSPNQTTFSNLRSDDITVYVNGQLQFTINYNAINPCAGYDCGNGACGAVSPNNTQFCICQGCYIQDGSGRCTVDKQSPCKGSAGIFCTASGGQCKETLDCGYYCKCPQLDPSCQTAEYCDEDSTACPPRAFSQKLPTFFARFLRFFN